MVARAAGLIVVIQVSSSCALRGAKSQIAVGAKVVMELSARGREAAKRMKPRPRGRECVGVRAGMRERFVERLASS